MNVLNGLPMIVKHINSDYGFVKFWIARLRNAVIFVLAVLKCIKALNVKTCKSEEHLNTNKIDLTFENEFEKSFQVFRARTSNEDVGITKANCGSH